MGIHKGSLWTLGGSLLAQATFTNESASGWQEVLFNTPVAITANTTYVASYHSPTGYYATTNPYFTTDYIQWSINSYCKNSIRMVRTVFISIHRLRFSLRLNSAIRKLLGRCSVQWQSSMMLLHHMLYRLHRLTMVQV